VPYLIGIEFPHFADCLFFVINGGFTNKLLNGIFLQYLIQAKISEWIKSQTFLFADWEQLLSLSLSPLVHIPEHHGKCPSEFILCAHLNSSAVIWIQSRQIISAWMTIHLGAAEPLCL
jgi:hypothetical protein